MAISTDGKHLFRWNAPRAEPISMNAAIWMPDGHRWVQLDRLGSQYVVLLFDLHSPRPRVLPITWDATVNKIYFYDPSILVLGFAPDGTVVTKGEANDGPNVLFRIKLGPTRAYGGIIRPDRSRSVGLMDMTLSPDGKHLAYRTSTQSLCVSRLDGSGEQEVTPGPVEIESIRWMPDCRHLSFGYDNSLYTVLAPLP